MSYAVVDVRIGHAAPFRLPKDYPRFHESLVRSILGSNIAGTRRGSPWTVPIDYHALDHQPERIREYIGAAIPANKGEHLDAIVFDFSANAFRLIREPLLVQLALHIKQLCDAGICYRYIVLLPALPSKVSASIQHLKTTSKTNAAREVLILVLDNVGAFYDLSGPTFVVPDLRRLYPRMRARFGISVDATSRLHSKLIRRIGHFRRQRHPKECRTFSYVTENSAVEFLELLERWWNDREPTVDLVVFKSESNPSLKEAIKTFALNNELECVSIPDCVSSRTSPIRKRLSCLLVLDVVETGRTLVSSVDLLAAVDVDVYPEVVAGITKGSTKLTIAGYSVRGFLSVPQEPIDDVCPQCALGLPFGSDQEEDTRTIRSFDMWAMADSVGWQREPIREVPSDIGHRYTLLPRFEALLGQYGDWLSYKMARRLAAVMMPETIFVIHPRERSASAVSAQLQKRFEGRLTIVQIPREAIKRAQRTGWRTAIDKQSEWALQLYWISKVALGQPAAIIIDIFNASGSTFRSLFQLLNHYKIQTFCYFPLVDRDPAVERGEDYPTKKFSLYDWYGPRAIRRAPSDRRLKQIRHRRTHRAKH